MASYLVVKLPTAATIFSLGTSLISKSRSSNNSSSMSRSSASSSLAVREFSSSLSNGVFFSSPGSSFKDNSSINNFGPSSPSASSVSSDSGMMTEMPEGFSFNELPLAAGIIAAGGLFKSHSCFTASSVSSLTKSGAFFFGIKKSKLGRLKLGLNLHMI